MKKFRIAYSEFVPVYDIEVEAENESEAYDKAKEILIESLDEEPDFWDCEEVIKVKSKDKR